MSDWRQIAAGEAFSILMGRQRSPSRAVGPNMAKYLRSANIGDGRLNLADVKEMDFSEAERARFRLLPGDVLVSEGSASADAVGMAAAWNGEIAGDVCFQNTLLRYRAVPGLTLEGFVLQWCRWAYESGAFSDVASGSNIKHIGSSRACAMQVILPPLEDQRRMVEVMSSVDAQVEALRAEVLAASRAYTDAGTVLWRDTSGREAPCRPLASAMALDVDRVIIEPSTRYRLAGVLNAGQGLIDKGDLLGSETGYSAMNRLAVDQVVMRKLTAWEGPIAVVREEFDGLVASNEFPTFTLGPDMCPAWFAHVCRSPRLWEEMRLRVTGSVQRRKRLNPDQLLSVTLPIPDLESQRRSAQVLDALLEVRTDAMAEADHLSVFRSTLLSALLSQQIEIPESYDALLDDAVEVSA